MKAIRAISAGFLAGLLACEMAARPCFAQTSSPQSLFTLTSEPAPGLASETDAGLVITTGNSPSGSLNVKQQTSYRWPVDTVEGQFRYLETSAYGVETAKYWTVGGRYERKLMSHLGGFVGETIEADTFSGYYQRYSSDVGMRRILWTEQKTRGAMELGYRYQILNAVVGGRQYFQIARVYGETTYQWNSNVSLIASVEALPNFSYYPEWMLNSDISISAELTKVFSLKTSYEIRYSHIPASPGLKTTDTALTSSLAAKF